MNWEGVLFYIGIANGILALMNVYLFCINYEQSPLWLKLLLLSVVFGCIVSFVGTMRSALA